MKSFAKIGIRRVAFPGAVAFVALSTHASAAASQIAAARAKPRVDTVTVTKQDTSTRATTVVMLRKPSPRIDSLLAALEGLQLGSPEAARIRDSLDAAIRAEHPRMPAQSGPQGFTIRINASTQAPSRAIMGQQAARDLTPRGWMGIKTNGVYVPSTDAVGFHVRYLEYPTVVEVEPNSPASRVGIRFGDSLVAYNGSDLLESRINLTQMLVPGRKVSVELRRDGETKNVAIVVEKAPPQVQSERTAEAVAEMYMVSRTAAPVMVIDSVERRLVETRAAMAGGMVRSGPTYPKAATPVAVPSVAVSGVLGAAMTTVDSDMAASLVGMKGKTGVLVTTVPPRSPAGRTGLRNGDVILRVEGNQVVSLPYLRFKLQQLDASGRDKIRLSILRAGKTLDVTVDGSR